MIKVHSCMSSEATTQGIAEQLAEQHRVSTDPKWCEPTGGQPVDTVTTVAGDGRNRRRARSNADILQAARAYLLEGNYRPSMSEICDRAGYSLRTGFDHFRTVENLLLTVLDMNGMAATIAVVAVSGTPLEIARRLVRGR